MSDKYILDGKTPVPADLMTWATWFEKADRHVARTVIGPYLVSTIFLGLDHQFGNGPPLLFETMIFAEDDWTGEYQERCSTWDEAEEQHKTACDYVRQSLLCFTPPPRQ